MDPTLLTCAERIQYDGYLRRQENHQAINDWARGRMAAGTMGADQDGLLKGRHDPPTPLCRLRGMI